MFVFVCFCLFVCLFVFVWRECLESLPCVMPSLPHPRCHGVNSSVAMEWRVAFSAATLTSYQESSHVSWDTSPSLSWLLLWCHGIIDLFIGYLLTYLFRYWLTFDNCVWKKVTINVIINHFDINQWLSRPFYSWFQYHVHFFKTLNTSPYK